MAKVNWLQWIVLRCEAKLIQMEILERESGWREGRRLIGEEESFPEKDIKLIDDSPGGMFPQVCFVCV